MKLLRGSRPTERLLYLPPYSPDFNPIEMAIAKLKALLRKAAARSVDELAHYGHIARLTQHRLKARESRLDSPRLHRPLAQAARAFSDHSRS